MKIPLGLALALLTAPAHAVTYPVDTGVPTGPGELYLAGSQWLAAEFTLSDTVTISGAEMWLAPVFGAGTIPTTVAFYTDGGSVPGSELFSSSFVMDSSLVYGWRGVAGLSLTLDPGTYWVAFEPRQCSTPCLPNSYQAVALSGAPTPLGGYAFFEQVNGLWLADNSADLGIRISVVPLPAAAWLFGSSLILLGWRRRQLRAPNQPPGSE